MLDIMLKYFFICICSVFLYRKLLNTQTSKNKTILSSVFSICFAGFAILVRTYATSISIVILAFLFSAFVGITFRNSFNISIVTSIISLGLSFSIFLLSTLFTIPIGYIAAPLLSKFSIFDTILIIIAGLIENILIRILFRLKRLKNGMPYLLKKGSSDIGVFISVSILVLVSFYFDESAIYIHLFLMFLTICGGLFVFFWWRKKLYNDYLKKLNENETHNLLQVIVKQSEEIAKLKAHNEKLSKIIHKDNKLIPAMQIAVKDLLESGTADHDHTTGLLTQLNWLYDDRNIALQGYEILAKSLPKSGILSTDAVIKYLSNRSVAANTSFDVTVTGNIKYLVSEIIAETDLNTLLSDLGENAIIAVQNESQKSVLLNIGIDENNYYRIDIFDSGSPFSIDVLKNMGKQRITTHAETGGSGIGLMTAFEILNKYNASFLIDENIQHNLYTKKVSIIFDEQKNIDILKIDCTNNDNL